LNRFESEVRLLAQRLTMRGWKLCTAESCTGGLIAAACTGIAGSSDWFERGFVTYSNESKTDLLEVAAVDIERHGAVSAVVAEAMAEGALRRSQADLAVAVTGIAGPGGATPGKPVGTVYLSLAVRGGPARSERLNLTGDRAQIRDQTVLRALQRAAERAAQGL